MPGKWKDSFLKTSPPGRRVTEVILKYSMRGDSSGGGKQGVYWAGGKPNMSPQDGMLFLGIEKQTRSIIDNIIFCIHTCKRHWDCHKMLQDVTYITYCYCTLVSVSSCTLPPFYSQSKLPKNSFYENIILYNNGFFFYIC